MIFVDGLSIFGVEMEFGMVWYGLGDQLVMDDYI